MTLVAEQEFILWDGNTMSGMYSWPRAAHILCTELNQQRPTPNLAHCHELPYPQINKPSPPVTAAYPENL